MNNLERQLKLAAMDAIQDGQFTSKLVIEDTVPANSEKTQKLTIDNLGDFLIYEITGSFETLTDNAGTIEDNGVCSLRTQITDESNTRRLTNDAIPLNLLLTPGRRRSEKIAAGTDNSPYPDPLFVPLDFKYLLNAQSLISFKTRNDSNTPQSYTIVLHGIKFDKSAKK